MKVSLFVTCLVDQFYPQIAVSAVKILEQLGIDVHFDVRQTCCGQPAFNSGFTEEAKQVGCSLLDIYKDQEWIVTPSGSCCSMMKVFLPELLSDEPRYSELAQNVSTRVWEFSDFLVSVLKVESMGASFRARATYHDSCHLLRELGIQEPPRKLLNSVAGLDLQEMENSEQCCGFGGSFSVKFAEVSSEMGRKKLQAIEQTGAQYVIAADASCLMHLEGLINRQKSQLKTMHIAEVLARF